MKINYDVLMQKEMEKFNHKKKLLLHSCCGPCSSAVILRLKDYFDITILYYNPNIEPEEEYIKRKNEQKRLIHELNLGIHFKDSDYEHEAFLEASKHLEKEPEGGARCHKCYYLRLQKTADLAKKEGFDYFGTTLTVSPYKNSEVINSIGLLIEKDLNKAYYEENKSVLVTRFLVSDFKKREGYKKSIELSKTYHLYRQDYCGCLFAKDVDS